MNRRLLPLVPAALLAAAPAWGGPHRIDARIGPSGLAFLERHLPDHVPPRLEPPPLSEVLLTCSGDRQIVFTQRDTVIDVAVRDLSLATRPRGVLEVSVLFDLSGHGEAHVDNVWFCFGETTCADHFAIRDARATVELRPSVDGAGAPRVEVLSVDLDVDHRDVELGFSGCALGELANAVIGIAKKWIVSFAVSKLEAVAADVLAPLLEDLLGGFARLDAGVASATLAARLTGIEVDDGIRIGGTADLTSRFPAAACVGADPGEPPTHAGPAPDLRTLDARHVGLSVNLGLVDDVLHHVWREGLLCVPPDAWAALGLDLEHDVEKIADLLPTQPPGTRLELAARAPTPPRIRGVPGPGAGLVLELAAVEVTLTVRPPSAEPRRVTITVAGSAAATARLDPAINALVLDLDDVRLDGMAVDDELGLEARGIDFGRIRQLVEEKVLPALLAEAVDLPLTGPIAGGLAGYYVILRDLRTTAAHLVAGADLFRAPAEDGTPPRTWIARRPTGVVRPRDAIVVAGGDDEEIPAELLRFRVVVDGAERPLSYVRSFRVGKEGRTAIHRVSVAAVDLHGNEDPSPALLEVAVDGVRPRVRVTERPAGEIREPAARIAWVAEDDLTPADRLGVRLELWRIARDGRSSELLEERDLPDGATDAEVELPGAGSYRIILAVRDEAGNEGISTIHFAAGDGGACGCRVGGAPRPGAGAGPLLLAAGALLVAAARRRRGGGLRSGG